MVWLPDGEKKWEIGSVCLLVSTIHERTDGHRTTA